jgi:hypothetical protein
MPVHAEAPQQLSDDAQFAMEFAQALDPAAPEQTRLADEQEALEMARHLDNVDEQLLVLDGLYGRAAAANRGAVARAIEAGEDLKFGDGLIEVTNLEDLHKAGERILKGRNPAIVVRAAAWGDDVKKAGELVPTMVGEPDQFAMVGSQKFPKPNMPTGSTGVHLDNFTESAPFGFRYGYSAAQVVKGKVLFMAGIAGKKGRAVGPRIDGESHPYYEATSRLDADPRVQHQYKTAQEGRPRSQSEFTTVEGRKMVTVVIHEGDTVIWPQGGTGTEAPAWHAFRKIGTTERESMSYHYAQQPPQPQPEQPARLPQAA